MGIGSFVNRSAKPAAANSAHQSHTSTGDLILVAAVIALAIFGLLMVYSASTDFSLLNYKSPTYMFNKQVIWTIVGTLVAFLVSRFDYHQWRRYALPLMSATIIMLVAILFIKDVRNGAVRTFFGGSIQPSEMAKLALILYLSVWLYAKKDFMHDIQLGLIPLAVILGGVAGLIYVEPDLSATITIFLLGGLLFFLAGGDLRQIVLFCFVALLAGWIVVQFSSTGRTRLASYLAGLKDPLKSSDHILWSLEAIYKGKFFGVGIGNATTKLIGLPFSATDSIFAVIVEELGLFGALALIALYGIVLWRGLVIAQRAPDLLGSMLAAGLTFWIIIEALINMTMIIGLIPVAGNALPFMSAGGSNLISSLTAIGILLSISRQSGKKAPVENEKEERKSYSASVDLRRRDRRRGVSRTRRPASYPR
jgi:cell division protein FtsW